MSFDIYRSMGKTMPNQSGNTRTRRPKYVKLAPGDVGEFLPDVFFEDPRTFSPKPGPMGQIHAWGLYPYTSIRDPHLEDPYKETNWTDFDGIQAAMRQMASHMIYDSDKTPESQFIKVILDRKRKQLETIDLKGLDKCDILCLLYLPAVIDKTGEHRVWRLFKVSGGITLSAFQDKAIAPIMGWVRNLHSYTFTDFRDGALFGPEGSNSVDQMHKAHVGYEYLPDSKYKFAHLFEKEGDEIGYLYDFGDKCYHRIEILKIFPPEESSGAIEVIDGKGMCPGENLRGNLLYASFLEEYDNATYSKQAEKKREILAAPNYYSFGKPPSLIDPAAFDVVAAKERIAEALSSVGSVHTGSKKFHIPVAHDAERTIEKMEQQNLKKNQSILNQRDGVNAGFWNETISNKKDSRKEAVCSFCGKPAAPDVELKSCAGCQQALYCSREHQKAHWKSIHKKVCSQKYPKAK